MPRLNINAIRRVTAVCVCSALRPPVLGHELGHHDRDRFVGLAQGIDLIDIGQQRLDQQPVGRIQDNQPHAFTPGLPPVLHLLSFGLIKRNIHGRHVIRKRPGIGKGCERAAMHAADRQDDPVTTHARRRTVILQRQLAGQMLVVRVNPEKDQHQHWHQYDDDPGPAAELCHRKHDHDDQCADCADGIDDQFGLPARFDSAA